MLNGPAVALRTRVNPPSRMTSVKPDFARLRNWLDTHTDQVIIIVSLGLGLWLVGKSVYLLVT